MAQSHKIVEVKEIEGIWQWKCNCGKSGKSSAAFEGDDVRTKAKKGGELHVKRTRTKRT